jgi:hypothetical protein
LSLRAGIAIAAALLAVVAVVAWRGAPKPAPAVASATPAASGPRIFYPPDSMPVLGFPDGRSETIRSLLNIRAPMQFGDYVWNDEAVPHGPVWIRVDLARQIVSVFRAGHEIGSAIILYGTDGKPTPTGVFPILERARTHRSNLYDAEMPFMLRLTNDGVAIHASRVREGSATHGCIGIPLDFARRVFDEAKRGDLVIVEAGEKAPHSG